jgi:hypothetical protein
MYRFSLHIYRVTKEVATDSAEAILSTEPSPASPAVSQEERQCRGRHGMSGFNRLALAISQPGKKSKLGTLEKSKLDWDHYKKDEGIEEELQRHNKGRDG